MKKKYCLWRTEGGSKSAGKRKNRKHGKIYTEKKEKVIIIEMDGALVAIKGRSQEKRKLIKELKTRDRDIQRQEEGSRIDKARYNQRYKEIRKVGKKKPSI